MFANLKSSCPHCLLERAFLFGIQEYPKTADHHYTVIFKCRSCEKLTIAEFEDISRCNQGPIRSAARKGKIYNIPDERYHLLDLYPKPVTPYAPEHTPDACAKFFIEAKDNLARRRHETAVMLCRKVLDIATSHLEPDENTTSLAKRLYLLKEQSRITPEMADWAKIIRLDGNTSAHSDENFTEQEAREIISFTETFLLYAFTLPGMVKQWQRK